jgi:hypothetical protein
MRTPFAAMDERAGTGDGMHLVFFLWLLVVAAAAHSP